MGKSFCSRSDLRFCRRNVKKEESQFSSQNTQKPEKTSDIMNLHEDSYETLQDVIEGMGRSVSGILGALKKTD